MIFSIIVFLPILFVGFFLTEQMKQMALDQSFKEAENEIVRISSNLDELLDFNVTLQHSILADSSLLVLLKKEYHSSLEIFNAYNSYQTIEEYERIYEAIEDIRIYVDNDTLLDNLDFMRATNAIKESWWYKQALLWDGKIIASHYVDDITKREYLMICKHYQIGSSQDVVIMTLLNLDFIQEYLYGQQLNITILDAKSQILASTDVGNRGKNLYEVADTYIVPKAESWRDEYMGETSQLFLRQIKLNSMVLPLYVFSAVPLEMILQTSKEASQLGFFVIFVSIAAATLFILFFSKLLTKKISRMAMDMKKVATGEFDEVHVYPEEDEIGDLSRSLYQMSQSLSKLMQENLQIKESEKELILATEQMKFEVLKSQVNPHFLFNILESLRMKAHLNGDKDIAIGIKLLGQLMRRSLESTHDLVTIEEEIDFVRRYMELQKFRFGDRITYTIDCPHDILPVYILPLLMQPLVENSIGHGLEKVIEGGNISITVWYEEGQENLDKYYVVIQIKDNGKGMTPLELKQVQSGIQSPKSDETGRNHIGLANVYGRIKNFYGDESSLHIESENAAGIRGTTVTLKIPFKGGEKR